jgi:3'-phosphoadenosine 5'-phosphosulfate sulfotransferase (PAPS reductase)/FAD synthetase
MIQLLARNLPYDQIVVRAYREHRPSKVFVLFSGGNDSAVTLHALWSTFNKAEHLQDVRIDAAVHINTGTGIPQTRQFVGDFCDRYGIPLLEYFPPVSYREIVLKHGFPGPGAHAFPYRMLKERCVDKLVSDHKTHRFDRIMLITGVRASESTRRMGNVVPVERDGCSVWVAPLIDWTSEDMSDYRRNYDVPESEVAALLHMSGECLCGAFARPDEIKDLEAFYPDVAARIHALEDEVRAVGKPCVWGKAPPGMRRSRAGRLCYGCDARQLPLPTPAEGD